MTYRDGDLILLTGADWPADMADAIVAVTTAGPKKESRQWAEFRFESGNAYSNGDWSAMEGTAYDAKVIERDGRPHLDHPAKVAIANWLLRTDRVYVDTEEYVTVREIKEWLK